MHRSNQRKIPRKQVWVKVDFSMTVSCKRRQNQIVNLYDALAFFTPQQQKAFTRKELFGACIDRFQVCCLGYARLFQMSYRQPLNLSVKNFAQSANTYVSSPLEFGKHLRHNELKVLNYQCRDGRVVNARALRARGPPGPHGFESHSRRLNVILVFDR